MEPVNFLIFITHKFLFRLSKHNSEDIESRCLNGVSFILSLVFTFCFVAIGMILISQHLIIVKKLFWGLSSASLISIFTVAGIISIFIFIHKRYGDKYYQVVEEQDQKYNFSKPMQVVIFLLVLFTPFLMASLGLIFLRKLLY
jgi:uncharacterized protein YacL